MIALSGEHIEVDRLVLTLIYIGYILIMGTVVEFYGVKIRVNPRDDRPPYIHIVGNGGNARFNIEAMAWMNSLGFSRSDLKSIEEVIHQYIDEIRDEWRRIHEK